jgi:hypothetical protein
MNTGIEVKTQAELEATIKAGNIPVCIEGAFILSVGGTDKPSLQRQSQIRN